MDNVPHCAQPNDQDIPEITELIHGSLLHERYY